MERARPTAGIPDFTPTRRELASELQRRAEARRSLVGYSQYMMPSYLVGRHHAVAAEALERVERHELNRVIFSMPPRHGKSRQVAIDFPTWLLGRHPSWKVVQAGYAISLCRKHSREARSMYYRPEFSALFERPAIAKSDVRDDAMRSATEWETGGGGSYYAVGVRGGITGRGFDVGIIDDPYASRQDAESAQVRDSVRQWYQNDFYTRRDSETSAIIIVATRWHEDDLVGWLLKENPNEWHHVSFPAITTGPDGLPEALWPERWPVEELQRTRDALSAYEWASLYQQQPIVRGGNLFKIDSVQMHDSAPELIEARYCRFWDFAHTAKQRVGHDPDFTAGALCALTVRDRQHHLWILDVTAGRWSAMDRNQIVLSRAQSDGERVSCIAEETTSSKDSIEYLRSELRPIGRKIIGQAVRGDKVARSQPLEVLFESGRIHMIRGAWNTECLHQLASFPIGAHDDYVDAVAGAYEYLRSRGGAVRSHAADRAMANTRVANF